MSKHTPFPAGTEVEVRTREKGFHGAWFEATVESYSHHKRRYTVTYASLVADDDPAAPLRDVVFLYNVRPRPPRASRGAHFGLHRVVDAYHNDAWWKGVVSAVPDKEKGVEKYRVCFPFSREEFEFEEGDIREHVWLVRGNWVSIEAEGEHDLMFDVGARVEVSRDKETFGSAWFSGTVLKVIGKSYLLVEYESLWVEDDGSKRTLLQEIVGLPYIRPSPPLGSTNFDVLDEVEAFHCGGWFFGIVLKILPGPRYIIKLKHRVEELDLDHTALRPHFNWANGKWIHINQENCSRASVLRGTKSAGSRHKSKGPKSPYFPTSVPTLKTNDGGLDDASVKLKVEKAEGPDLDSQVNLSQSHKNSKKRRSLEHSLMVDATPFDCNSQTTTVVRKHSSIAAPPMFESPNPMDQIKTPRGSRTPRTIKSATAAAAVLGAATSKHQTKSSQPEKKLKTGNALEKLVGGSSEPATKLGENCVSEMPNPTLGNQHPLMVDATSFDCNCQTTTVVRKHSSIAAPMLESPNPMDQIKTPRGSRTPRTIKSSTAAAAVLGAATPKHQIKSSQPQKKLKKGNALEKLVSGSSEPATKLGENCISEMPNPTLGNQYSLMVDATSVDCKSQITTVVRKHSSIAAPMLERPNPMDQIKTPRGSRPPRTIKNSTAAASVLGAATSKHQIKSSQPQKKLKTGNALEKLVGGSSEPATKVGENCVSEMPNPTLGNQHSKSSSQERTAPSLKAGTNLPSISGDKSNKAADRSNIDLKDKKVERLNFVRQFKSSELHKKVKKGKLVKLKKRLVDGILMDSGSKTPTILRKVSSSSVPVLESPNLQGQIKSPHSRKFKEINRLVEDQLVDGSLMEYGSKAPTKAGKCTSATPLLKESSALMDKPQHLESPPLVKIAANTEVETKLPLNPSHRELCQDQDLSRVNATDESMMGYSKCYGTEHQPETANISHPSVNHETTTLISIAKANTKVQRKKPVVRPPNHHGKVLNADVKQPPHEKIKKKGRGRLSWKRIANINGMELKKVDERTKPDGKGEGNPPTTDDSYRSNKLLDMVEDHSETPQIDSSLQDARNVNNTTQLPSNVAPKSFDIEVQGIRSCVNVLSGVGAQAETQALLLISRENNASEKIDLTPTGPPYGKDAVEVETAPINPETSRSSPFKEDNGRGHNWPTSSVPPVEKAIEMDISPIDAQPSVQSLLKEVNVDNQNELNSVEFLIEKTMVEMERASVNPIPKELSPSREGDACDHNEVIPNGPESVNTIEMEERAHISPVHSALSDKTPLPFTKQSTVWDSVHLMDVYQIVPQQPHFRPLEQYSMEFREGIAIGLMVTFANLVAGIKKLRILDSQVVFEEKLKALVSLELNGFNVQFVRSCLEKLLEIRRSYNHLKEKKVDLEGKLVKKEDENSHLDALICAHDKIIAEVEESLANYRKKLSSLISERNNMDMEIVQLEMDLQAAEEAYHSAEENFNNAVAAPW